MGFEAPITDAHDGPAVMFRLNRPGDEAGIVAVFQAVFDSWPPYEVPLGPDAFLDWLLEPHGETGGVVFVAEMEGRIAAVRGGVRRPALVCGRVVAARQGQGAGVLPEYRRLRVYRRLNEWIREQRQFDLSWGFTQVEAIRRVVDSTVVERGDDLALFLKVEDAGRSSTSRGRARIASYLGYQLLRARGALARRRSEQGGWEIVEVTSFDERFAPFWERASEGWDFIPVRSADYLTWRFCDPRGGSYTVRCAYDGDELLGYVAFKREHERGYIADLLVLPDRADVAHALLVDACEALEEQGVAGTECWMMRRHPYAAALRRAGFVRLGGRSAELERKLNVRAETASKEELACLSRAGARIHIVGADSDLM